MKHLTKILRSQLMLLKPFISGCSLATARKWQEKIGKLMAHTHRNDVEYDEIKIGSLDASMITPKDELSSGVILYLHGGGYTAGNLQYAKGFGSVLAAKCGIRVLCVAYRLAPEHPFPVALDDSLDAYGYLLSSGFAPSQIILCGESAGGGLCYSLCQKLLEKGRTVPAGIIGISPWTDLTLSGASFEANEKNDPSLTKERLKYYADCYAYGAKEIGKSFYPNENPDPDDDRRIKSDYKMSPLFGTTEGMPPSLIFVGGDEILLDDSTLMHEKLTAFGCDSTLIVREKLWHGYVLYALKDCVDEDFTLIRRFIKKNVPLQKKLRWMSLDNAAKIFPAARRRNWSNVFRLSATLKEKIDPETLQVALDVTVRRFPSIAVRVKTGFFWYYLEEIPKAPKIIDEKPYPLSRMMFDDIRKCAFRVIHYENRIAVEFFHALTDGNGGLIFLKTLVSEYLYQKYGVKVPIGNGVLDRLEEPTSDETEDSFFKYAGPKSASRKDTTAFKLTGTREEDGFRTNTTFLLDAAEIAQKAKAQGVTVTAYLAAAMIMATLEIQKAKVKKQKKRRPVKILIPVNLRKLFPSKTLRNFALYASPGVDPTLGDYTFEEVCKIVHHQMHLMITEKNMAAAIATNINSEKPLLIKATPLFLKNIILKTVFNLVGERKSCFSLSNLGLVTMPEEFTAYVDRLDFVLGVQAAAPYNTGVITYNGKLCLNIIRNIEEPLLETALYRVFRSLSLKVVAESNSRIKN